MTQSLWGEPKRRSAGKSPHRRSPHEVPEQFAKIRNLPDADGKKSGIPFSSGRHEMPAPDAGTLSTRHQNTSQIEEIGYKEHIDLATSAVKRY